MKSPEAVVVTNLTTQYGKNIIHDGISFSIKNRSICTIIGGSGSGKSTLLRALLGLLIPTKGSIEILGKNIKNLDFHEIEKLRKRTSVLFQDGALFSGLTVLDNILFPLTEMYKIGYEDKLRIATHLLKLVGLDENVLIKMPNELSGGMRKRVGLARALILEPEILFLDEPTSGLDPISARHFDELIKNLHEKLNTTIIMISHDIESICSISEQIIALGSGKIIADGPANEVIKLEHPWIKEYFKSYMNNQK